MRMNYMMNSGQRLRGERFKGQAISAVTLLKKDPQQLTVYYLVMLVPIVVTMVVLLFLNSCYSCFQSLHLNYLGHVT